MTVFGVILAGGEGRRMGGADKALLTLGGRALVDIAAANLGPQVVRLAISANGDPAGLADRGLPVLPDQDRRGPLSGVLAALLWAAPLGARAVVSMPVDAPFCPSDLVQGLTAPGGAAYVVTAAGVHPACALWPVELAPALGAFLASGASPRVRDFLARAGATSVSFPDEAAFANINTAADLAALQARLQP
jgi:molybdopterin-guanine dinucleotide biosynthesis protein A